MYKVYATSSKKMLNMLILEILKVYSDEQKELFDKNIEYIKVYKRLSLDEIIE